MFSFKQLVTEAKKLTHLEHIEDIVLDEGSDGIERIFSFIDSLSDTLHGDAKENLLIQEKFDGSPSLIAGVNPENGKFFVATKAFFNKTPKINYTPEDIDANYGKEPGLAEKLKIALEHLPKNNIKGIVQGDFLFTSDQLQERTIDGERYITFKPNTIMYAVPVDSDLAKQIRNAKVGLIWHTTYTGSKLSDLNASFSIDVSSFTPHRDSFYTTTNYKDATGLARFTKQEQKEFNKLYTETKQAANAIDKGVLNELTTESGLIALLKVAINTNVRRGTLLYSEKNTIKLVIDVIKEQQAAGKISDKRAQTLIDKSRAYASVLTRTFKLQSKITEMKLFIIRKLEKVKRVGQFIQDGDDFKVTSPEGYVAIHDGEDAVKLVDRLNFSKINWQQRA